MKSRSLFLLAPGLLLALGATGCLHLKSRPDPARFYVLEPIPGHAATPTSGDSNRVAVLLTRIDLPEYLTRPGIVVREGDARVHLSDVHFWAEPLRDGATRVLREDLATRIESDQVEPTDGRRPRGPHLEVQVAFTRYELNIEQQAVLEARWRILAQPEGKLLRSGTSLVQKDFPTILDDYSPGILALSECLSRLADDLAAALRSETPPLHSIRSELP